MENLLDFGIRLIVAIQNLGEWQTLPMKFFSFLGTEEFYMLVLPVLYWCYSSEMGMRVAVILMLSGGLNGALKGIIRGPRPYWISTSVTAFASETSFGVPSGHSQNAMAVWGIMAAWMKKRWTWVVAILIVFLIGYSRLYLAVHFPHDVLSGWLIGGLLLILVWFLWKPVATWAKKFSPGYQVLIAFFASLILLLVSALPSVWTLQTGWQAPPGWASFTTQAISVEGYFTTAGTLFGLLAGAILLAYLGGFEEKGAWWKLVLRYVLGVAGVLALRYGLKFIFPDAQDLLSWSLRYLRYALIGFWMTGVAPWVFLKWKLAEKRASK
jgi:membrane-associated phospholipid phosphatase